MRKDGSRFFCNATIVPIYSEGRHIGFGKVVENLDERSRLIQERDISKTEADELKVEKGLIDQFTSALTHDLRTPLAAAQMSAQLIYRSTATNPMTEKLAHRIYENMHRMDTMIQDLLDTSRIRAGEFLPGDIQKCDLAAIASEVKDDLTTLYGNRFEPQAKPPLEGFWSPNGLRRILENLMSNAVKYGDGKNPVTVSLRRVDGRVLLTVHNFGPPIPLEDQLILFNRFRRGKSADAGDKKDWGLGLTLVRGLTEASGGTVKVESYPIEGTRFTVDLPMDARGVHGL